MFLQGYGSRRFVFQGVHETICYGPAEKPWGENEPLINQLVFIGRGLNRKSLMEGFRWVPCSYSGWRQCVVVQCCACHSCFACTVPWLFAGVAQ